METMCEKVSRIIKEYVNINGVSRKMMCETMGITPSYLCNIEGLRVENVSPMFLRKLSMAMGISTVELFIELGLINKKHEVEMGVIVDNYADKLESAYSKGRKEGYHEAKIKMANQILAL